MGAYNVLFYFDRLVERLPKVRRKLSPDHRETIQHPTSIFFIEVAAICWVGLTTLFVALHDMGIGNRGDPELFMFYMGQTIFGFIGPCAIAYLLNNDKCWARLPILLLTIGSAFFYTNLVFELRVNEYLRYSLISFCMLSVPVTMWYFYFKPNVVHYFSELRKEYEATNK